MAAHMGPAPWSEGYKRTNKRNTSDMEWSLNSGWRKKADDWEKNPKKPQMRKVRLFNGRTVEIPIDDYTDYIGHARSPTSETDSDIAAYIDNAFDVTRPERIQDIEGVGHIALIEYSPTFQLLRVEFTNDGAIVVFFRVPVAVYSELYYLASSKAMSISTVDGKQRHVLGMRFWDIVRIRGQREGARYRYEYVQEGSRSGPAFRAETGEVRAHETNEQIYDGYARKFLTGSNLDEYMKLKTEREKELYLHKKKFI